MSEPAAKQPMPKVGQWCHVEIPAKDVERSKEFYGNLFGWQFQELPMPEGSYTVYTTPGGGIGGTGVSCPTGLAPGRQ